MIRTILFVLGFIAVGVVFGYKAVSGRIRSKAAQNWPTVKGKVLTSEVMEDRFRNATGKASIAFVPEITYTYTVDGREYNGDTVIFGEITYDYITAARICEKFAVESEPNVYYDPAKPEESVLLPKATEGLRSLIPGIFFLAVGVVILVFALVFPK